MEISKKINKWISVILLFCFSFQFIGCYTTDNIYGEEIETIYSLVSAEITSYQNDKGVLYYKIKPMYQDTETGKYLINEMRDYEFYKLINHNPDFPFCTYSDVIYYRDNVLPKEITYKKREIIGTTERKYSPGKTFLVVGMPILGILTIILASCFYLSEKNK